MARAPLGLVGLACLVFHSPTQSQALPQAAQVHKQTDIQLTGKLLQTRTKIEFFHLGAFKATDVEPNGDATPESFSGTATFDLPAPLGPQKLPFKGLVLKGNAAEGTLDALLKDIPSDLHGWTCHITRVVLSDKGSRLEGTATLAGIKLDLSTLTLTSQCLSGTLTPGDLPLAEGPFEATLLGSEVNFLARKIELKGNLEVLIDPPLRHGLTGAELKLDAGPITFDSALLSGSGSLATVAKNLPLLHKGQTWLVETMTLAFERGIPTLGGPTRLQFPLQVFCRVGATDQPYVTDAVPCHIQGQVPPATTPKLTSFRVATLSSARKPKLVPGAATWDGFSATFNLGAASLHPSGLTAFKVDMEKGHLRVDKGQLMVLGTALTGTLSWGPAFAFNTHFTNAPASLADGLYLLSGPLNKAVEVGAYRVHLPLGKTVVDFSPSASPEGLADGWMGVYLPKYALALPDELFTYTPTGARLPVLVNAQAGRFEGNATFSGALGVDLTKLVNLHIAPVQLEPFDLNFVNGALLHGPVVKGHLNLTAKPLLDDFTPPCTFHLTQNGAEQIEIDTQTPTGPMAMETSLIGISMVLDSAILHPTNLDFTGRFDFAITGAALPSVAFDHLVLDASGGGIDGNNAPLSLDFKGSRWSNVADRLHVNLWGFPFGLGETGYGVLADKRFYVGLGGDFEVNSLLPIEYNRIFFTTEKEEESQQTPALGIHSSQPTFSLPKEKQSKGTLELEKLFDIDQSVASMGTLKASLGFHVETAGDQVSEAYFLGSGKLGVAMGESSFNLDAGLRFGRSYQDSAYFPYFYALGHFEMPGSGIVVAQDLQLYGFTGGLAQNFLPDEIRNTTEIKGKADKSLGVAIMAGVDLGSADQFAFHGLLDLYISQNFTTILQGKGWLFCGRESEPPDNQVTADLRFTRNPNAFDATLTADLNLCGGVLRSMGEVQLHFAADKQFIHVGTKETPISMKVMGAWDASGYMTADIIDGTTTLGAGATFGYSKEGDFGIIWGHAWLNAQGDLIIEIDDKHNPRFLGTLMAEGGAAFGMQFKTFWNNYKVTIFNGSIGANLAFQAPGAPTLSGAVSIHYSVLGGLFSGSVGASLDM